MDEAQILSQPVALPDGINYDEYIIATYLISYHKIIPVPRLSLALAIEQSTGTWVAVPGETPEVRCQHVAKVIGVYEVPDYEFEVPHEVETRDYIVQIAFPEVNIGEQIPMLLTAVVGNISFNSAMGRVKRYMEIEKQVYEEKGERTLYTVNISDKVPKIFENAKRAVELGCNALMINYLAVGLPVMRAIAEDPDINVPILAHMDVAGAMYMSPFHGLSSHIVLGKLPRLAGADIVVIPAPYGKAPVITDKFLNVARTLSFPLYNLKPTWPMPSGGITPSMTPDVMRDLGNDIVIGSGGGIHAHPQGPIAGAKAFRQAIDAVMQGISLEEYSKDHPELEVAHRQWAEVFKKGLPL